MRMGPSDYRTLVRSLAGGEIAEEMYGRIDLPQYSTGAKLLENMIVRPHGPVHNRPGTQFVREVKDSNKPTRLIPFIRGNGRTLVLEVGHQYMRFHTTGGTVLDTSGALQVISTAEGGLGTVFTTETPHGYSIGESVVLTGFDTLPTSGEGSHIADLMNVELIVASIPSASSFSLTQRTGTVVSLWEGSGGKTKVFGTVAQIAAPLEVVTPYAAEDVFGLKYAQRVDTLTLAHGAYEARDLTRVADDVWTFDAVGYASTLVAPTSLSAESQPGLGGAPQASQYVVTAVKDGEESVSAEMAEPVLLTNWVAGYRGVLSWTHAPEYDWYNVYKSPGVDGYYGFIGQAVESVFEDLNILPDFSITPPTPVSELDTPSNYPRTVAYHSQRRIFGGTDFAPQSFWASVTGLPNLFTSSNIPKDTDAFTFELSATEANDIRNVVTLGSLFMLTGGAVFRVYPITDQRFAASSIDAEQVSAHGCSDVQPAVSPDSILYAHARGEHVIALRPSSGGIQSTDVSVIAPHLIDGKRWVQLQWQQAPYPVLWGVRDDGALIGMTFMPDQQVVAWHQHRIAGGDVESVAVVPEGVEDAVYVIVRRQTKSGVKRYVEVLREYSTTAPHFLDSALRYRGDPTDEVSGLDHLAGEEVAALLDGVPYAGLTVDDAGVLALPHPAEDALVGLPYTARGQLLPLTREAQAAGLGLATNVVEVALQLDRTGEGVEVGPSFTDMYELGPQLTDSWLGPQALRSGIFSVGIDPSWADGTVCFRQTKPLPMFISAVILNFTAADAYGSGDANR